MEGLNRTKGWGRENSCLCLTVLQLGSWSSAFGLGLRLELHTMGSLGSPGCWVHISGFLSLWSLMSQFYTHTQRNCNWWGSCVVVVSINFPVIIMFEFWLRKRGTSSVTTFWHVLNWRVACATIAVRALHAHCPGTFIVMVKVVSGWQSKIIAIWLSTVKSCSNIMSCSP